MRIVPETLFSRGRKENRINIILQLPIVRIILALLSLIPGILIFNLFYSKVLKALDSPWTSYRGDAGFLFVFVLVFIGYSLYVRRIEQRPVIEFGRENILRDIGIGFTLSAIFVFGATLVIFWFGIYRVTNTNSTATLFHALVVFGLLAFVEELIFRGILLRIMEEILGTWLSILIIAVLFGLAHLIHEWASAISTVSIALQDLILSAAFVLTRKVWLSWGIHWGWNYAQDGILGMPNSSVEILPSWIIPEVSGPTWITGGNFGIELSLVGVLLNILAGVIIIKIAIKSGQMLSPVWNRNKGS